jgi:hypothetical protein
MQVARAPVALVPLGLPPRSARYSVERDRLPALGAFHFDAPRALVACESGDNGIHVPKIAPGVSDFQVSPGVHGPGPAARHYCAVPDGPACRAVGSVTRRIAGEFNSPHAIETAAPSLCPDRRHRQPKRKAGNPQPISLRSITPLVAHSSVSQRNAPADGAMVHHRPPMPPMGPLSSCERRTQDKNFRRWNRMAVAA